MPRISKLTGWILVSLGGIFSIFALSMAIWGVVGSWLTSPGGAPQPAGGTIPGTSYFILVLLGLTIAAIGAQFIWWFD